MPTIRIWILESDYDEKAIQILAQKFVAYSKRTDLRIYTAGKKAYNPVARRLQAKPNGLEKAVEVYLKEADTVIFVIDSDDPNTLERHRQEKNSFISQIERVKNLNQFKGRVYVALAIQELEAWLLVDCVGVCCFFAKGHIGDNNRSRIESHANLKKVIRKYQGGDTELIGSGSDGAKEHLIRFSKDIIRTLNPRIRLDTLDEKKYREELAPDVAEYIDISPDTLRKNPSLQTFYDLLIQPMENTGV